MSLYKTSIEKKIFHRCRQRTIEKKIWLKSSVASFFVQEDHILRVNLFLKKNTRHMM